MWVWVTFAYLIPAVLIAMQILSPASRDSGKPMTAWAALAVEPQNGFTKKAL